MAPPELEKIEKAKSEMDRSNYATTKDRMYQSLDKWSVRRKTDRWFGMRCLIEQLRAEVSSEHADLKWVGTVKFGEQKKLQLLRGVQS